MPKAHLLIRSSPLLTDATASTWSTAPPTASTASLADRRPGTAELPALPEADTLVVRDLELLEARMYTLLLRVTDAATGKPLEGVHTILTKKPVGTVLVDANTSATGELRTTLDNAAKGDALNMTVRLEREGYVSKTLTYSEYIGADPEIKVHGALDLSMQPLEVGADLGKLIDIKPIYFDLGKHAIRKDAAAELDKIVAAMKEYPTMIIELGSHTDCRSSIASNAALSDRRAKSSAAYIVGKGIVADRISGKGYGESKLINGCACEGRGEEHLLRSRTPAEPAYGVHHREDVIAA
jgi:outer membrane protein OmpA-like peptidoglycan-associated protein